MASQQEPLRILLIKRKEDSLEQAEKHLIRRGYHVVSVVPLKVAVLKALEIKAEFVLVPLDHPNPAAKQLPQVLQQLLKCHVIPYVESQTASSILEIRRQGLKYNVLPPILGPKIERMINRVLFDQKSVDDMDRRRQEIQQKISISQTDVIKVKGAQESHTISSGSTVESPSLFKQFLKATSVDQVDLRSEDPGVRKQKSTEFFVSHLKSVDEKELPWNWRKQPGEAEQSYQARLRDALLRDADANQVDPTTKEFFEKVEVKAMENCLNRLRSSGVELSEDTNYEPSTTDLHRAMVDLAFAKGAPQEFLRKPHEAPQAHLDRLSQALTNHRLKDRILKEFQQFQSQAEAGSDIGLLNPDVNQVLDEATYQALLKVHERSEVKETQHLIQETKNMTCMVVNKDEHRGYVVMTTAKDQIQNPEFQKCVLEEFQRSLSSQGIDLDETDVHQIEVQSVPFIDWATKRANFIKQSSFEGDEVGLAFFPVKEFKPEFKKSSYSNLWQVKIAELRTRVRMDFNLYLNLPLNEKLLLYIPKGMNGVEKQLDRLNKKGVEYLYVKDQEMPEVRKYQAENFFGDQIESYESELTRMRVRVVGE